MVSIGLINWYYNRKWWVNILYNIFLPIGWDKKNFDINGLSIILWILVLILIL